MTANGRRVCSSPGATETASVRLARLSQSRSISSDFPVFFDAPIKAANPLLNPHVRYFDGLKRGYLRCEVGRDAWRTDVRVVDTIYVRKAPVSTSASFAVEAGTATLIPA